MDNEVNLVAKIFYDESKSSDLIDPKSRDYS